ncbi:MAG: ABC transporter permease [Nitrososphaerales archaeon]
MIDLRRSFLISKKDIQEIYRRKYIIISVFVLPVAFSIIFPILLILLVNSNSINESQVIRLREIFPELVYAEPKKIFLSYILESLTTIFIILPAILPSILASYSFVGEKTNKSFEPLLSTPIKELELLLGKYLACFIPVIIPIYLSFILYSHLLNGFIGFNPLLNLKWILALLTVAPLYSILSIGFNVLISSKVSDIRSAQQLGGLIVLPSLLIFFSSLFGLTKLDISKILILDLGLALAALLLFYISSKVFSREEILVRWR